MGSLSLNPLYINNQFAQLSLKETLMNTNIFKAMIVKEDDGKYVREIGNKNMADLP